MSFIKILPQDFLDAAWENVSEKVACPVPHEQFFDIMTPRGEGPHQSLNYDFSGLPYAVIEYDAYRILADAAEQLCPNFQFVLTQPEDNPDVLDGLRPLLACYSKDVEISNDPSQDWKNVEMFVHFSNHGRDPWMDSFDSKQLYNEHLEDRRLQFTVEDMHRYCIAAYAKIQMVRQHRNFVYSISLHGRYVRFYRWDHSGVGVSEQVDCKLDGSAFAAFLQRFNSLDRKWRGWDQDVSVASEEERDLLKDAILNYLEAVRDKEKPMIPYLHETLDVRWPFWVVDLKDRPYPAIGRGCRIVIGRHIWHENATGYIAWDLERSQLVFYKNSWVTRGGWVVPLTEGAILRQLKERQVPHLPTVYYASGPCAQFPRVSLNQLFETKNYSGLLRRDQCTVHVQLVEDILYPLVYVRNSRQLVSAIQNVIETLYMAHIDYNQGISHLDVNIGNVMVRIDGEGVLADWGLACDDIWCRPGPWGTIHFRPLDDGSDDPRQTTFKQDLESCFWTLIFMGEWSIKRRKPGENLFVENKRDEFLLSHEQTPVEYMSEPFTKLISNMRALWALEYRGTMEHPYVATGSETAEDLEVLEKNDNIWAAHIALQMIAHCRQALEQDGWYEDDAVRHRIHRQRMNLAPAELDPSVSADGDMEQLDGFTHGWLDYFMLPDYRYTRPVEDIRAQTDDDHSTEDIQVQTDDDHSLEDIQIQTDEDHSTEDDQAQADSDQSMGTATSTEDSDSEPHGVLKRQQREPDSDDIEGFFLEAIKK